MGKIVFRASSALAQSCAISAFHCLTINQLVVVLGTPIDSSLPGHLFGKLLASPFMTSQPSNNEIRFPMSLFAGVFGEVPAGYGRSAEQGAADGSLPAAGQLYTCSPAQPQPQDESGGM